MPVDVPAQDPQRALRGRFVQTERVELFQNRLQKSRMGFNARLALEDQRSSGWIFDFTGVSAEVGAEFLRERLQHVGKLL